MLELKSSVMPGIAAKSEAGSMERNGIEPMEVWVTYQALTIIKYLEFMIERLPFQYLDWQDTHTTVVYLSKALNPSLLSDQSEWS